MLVNIILWVLNVAFNTAATAAQFSFVRGGRAQWALGLFNNGYWLIIGLYYCWHANLAITVYFVIANSIGFATWQTNKLNKYRRAIWLALIAFLLLALATTLYSGGFKSTAALVNYFNVWLYGIGFTLKLYNNQKLNRIAAILFLINSVVYLGIAYYVRPILWACIFRQIVFMVPLMYCRAFMPNGRYIMWVKSFGKRK
jgi:hypothetical protein